MNLMLSERRQSQMTTYFDSIDTDSVINQTLSENMLNSFLTRPDFWTSLFLYALSNFSKNYEKSV